MTKNYYSVAKGTTIGIFTEWSKTASSVHKFRHAVFKGFKTIDAAVAFLIAGNIYQSCKNIPVHDETTVVKLPKDFGHLCANQNPCSMDSIDTSLFNNDEINIEEELQINEETGVKQTIDCVPNQPAAINSPNTKQLPKTAHVNKEASASSVSSVTFKQCTAICTKSMNKFMIQCNKCSEWTHYECTLLPAYQIHLLVTTSRRYTCEACSNVPIEFKNKWSHISIPVTNSTKTTEITHEIVNRIEKSVIAAITETHEKCQSELIHELKLQLDHERKLRVKDQLVINSLEPNISKQVQDLSAKIEEYAIPKKELTSKIDELKDLNAPLISAAKTTQEIAEKMENIAKTGYTFTDSVSRMEKSTNKLIDSLNNNSEKTMLLLDALVQKTQLETTCNVPIQNRFAVLSEDDKETPKKPVTHSQRKNQGVNYDNASGTPKKSHKVMSNGEFSY